MISAPDSSGDSKKSSNVNDAPIALARLSVRREYLFVADGETDRRRLVVVQARRRPIPREAAGEGFTATKKVGNSVVRNRARRRLREISRQRLPLMGLPGVDYVFIARQETAECPWARLLDDVETALLSLRRRFAAGEDVAAPRGRPRPNPKA